MSKGLTAAQRAGYKIVSRKKKERVAKGGTPAEKRGVAKMAKSKELQFAQGLTPEQRQGYIQSSKTQRHAYELRKKGKKPVTIYGKSNLIPATGLSKYKVDVLVSKGRYEDYSVKDLGKTHET